MEQFDSILMNGPLKIKTPVTKHFLEPEQFAIATNILILQLTLDVCIDIDI